MTSTPSRVSTNPITDDDEGSANKKRRIAMRDQSDSNSADVVNFDDKPLIALTADNVQKLLSQYECCVCLEYIEPPILQCPNSHLFCRDCRRKLNNTPKCPTCRTLLPKKLDDTGRNHSLEQMAVNLGLQFPCKFQTNGCPITFTLTGKLVHEESCEYRPHKCPDYFNFCTWNGLRKDVVQHLVDVHHYQSQSGNQIMFESPLMECSWKKLMTFKNQQFFFIVYHYESKLEVCVFIINEERIADQFKYKLEISAHSKAIRLCFEDKPIAIQPKDKFHFPEECGLVLDHLLVNRLRKDNRNLKISLTISDVI